MTDEDKVKQLTQKLKEKGDIALKEADWIYSLLKRGSQVLVLRGKPRPDPIENIVRAKLEQEAVREAVKNENFWLEETR